MKKAKASKVKPRSATAVDAYIGARMRERRLALNMNQRELGVALGVSFQQIQKYERGLNRVSAARLYEFCKVLKVPFSFMFERDPSASGDHAMTTVWIYVDTNKEVGDREHLKVFANADAAEKWFEENDPLGVAFEYEVIEPAKRSDEFFESPGG